jgi:hypothetical protein
MASQRAPYTSRLEGIREVVICGLVYQTNELHWLDKVDTIGVFRISREIYERAWLSLRAI